MKGASVKFVPMKELLTEARKGGYAVPSFCVWNAETLLAVMETAEKMRSPVIVMNGPGELGLLPPEIFAGMAREIVSGFNVPTALHLDHGDSVELIRRAISSGYTSVMLDFSLRPFDENVRAMKEVVEIARSCGVTVEGEIGHVGKVDAVTLEGGGDSTLTSPQEAEAFAGKTGVDALAVSIGNAHGQYTRLPKLDFERLSAIGEAVEIPLVLHGGSGTPDADIRRAISLGMAKINVATDLVAAWRESIRTQWAAGRNMWAPMAMADAVKAMLPVIERWIRLTGAEGRA